MIDALTLSIDAEDIDWDDIEQLLKLNLDMDWGDVEDLLALVRTVQGDVQTILTKSDIWAQIDARMGRESDGPSQDTFFGRMAEVQDMLELIGPGAARYGPGGHGPVC